MNNKICPIMSRPTVLKEKDLDGTEWNNQEMYYVDCLEGKCALSIKRSSPTGTPKVWYECGLINKGA